ncbi:hypothetical protein EOM39_01260 [Candidatus Gracilibacteria bacterium]|nr:hypothetical protein [Candidatus Gracilibacteria bacterium]
MPLFANENVVINNIGDGIFELIKDNEITIVELTYCRDLNGNKLEDKF